MMLLAYAIGTTYDYFNRPLEEPVEFITPTEAIPAATPVVTPVKHLTELEAVQAVRKYIGNQSAVVEVDGVEGGEYRVQAGGWYYVDMVTGSVRQGK